jgi:hypothetical protein
LFVTIIKRKEEKERENKQIIENIILKYKSNKQAERQPLVRN